MASAEQRFQQLQPSEQMSIILRPQLPGLASRHCPHSASALALVFYSRFLTGLQGGALTAPHSWGPGPPSIRPASVPVSTWMNIYETPTGSLTGLTSRTKSPPNSPLAPPQPPRISISPAGSEIPVPPQTAWGDCWWQGFIRMTARALLGVTLQSPTYFFSP